MRYHTGILASLLSLSVEQLSRWLHLKFATTKALTNATANQKGSIGGYLLFKIQKMPNLFPADFFRRVFTPPTNLCFFAHTKSALVVLLSVLCCSL
jgi:hypothetical protein